VRTARDLLIQFMGSVYISTFIFIRFEIITDHLIHVDRIVDMMLI
jgi:hypothetical protein